MKVRALFLALLALAACDKAISTDELPDSGDKNGVSIPTEPEMRTIRVRAGEPESKTTLDGNTNKILWDNGDQFLLVGEGPKAGQSTTLRITATAPGMGLGIPVISVATSSPDVFYGSVKVVLGGVDITSSILADSDVHNHYGFGVSNSSDKYVFPQPGTSIKGTLKSISGNKVVTILRTSSGNASNLSASNELVVTFKDFTYKLNWGSNTTISESTSLTNGWTSSGTTLSPVSAYIWMHGLNAPLTLQSEAGKAFGDFVGSIGSDMEIDATTLAVFPRSAYKEMGNGTISFTLPAQQTYVVGTFDHAANIMVGDVDEVETDVYDAHFKNMLGVLELSLKGDCSVESIVVTDKAGKQLWGTATIASADFANGISVNNVSGGSSSITLNCGGVMLNQSEATKFYIVVPAGAFQSGMDVKVNAADGASDSFGTSKNNSIARSIIKHMPAVTVDPIAVHNIENSVLKSYLDMSHYSTWGSSTYFSGSLASNCVDKDYPMPYEVSWTGNASSYNVSLTDITSGANIFQNRAVSTNSYSFENMIPGHKYSYSVSADGVTVASGKFLVEGRVRMVNIEDSWNYRDLGGWTGRDGRTIKFDKIFRGGSLNGYWSRGTASNYTVVDQTNPANYVFSAKSRQQMEDMGISAELDLRTNRAEEGNDRATDYSHAWSLGQSNTGITDYNFNQIKTSGAQGSPLTDDAVVRDVEWIIDQVLAGRKVAFHCKSGADRTGCVAFTIYALLGVSLGDIAFEFEITNFSHEQKIVKGRSEIRGKYTNKVGDAFYTKGFTTLGQGSLQQNAYYYLNQYFGSKGGTTISSAKLNNFIDAMLSE